MVAGVFVDTPAAEPVRGEDANEPHHESICQATIVTPKEPHERIADLEAAA